MKWTSDNRISFRCADMSAIANAFTVCPGLSCISHANAHRILRAIAQHDEPQLMMAMVPLAQSCKDGMKVEKVRDGYYTFDTPAIRLGVCYYQDDSWSIVMNKWESPELQVSILEQLGQKENSLQFRFTYEGSVKINPLSVSEIVATIQSRLK